MPNLQCKPDLAIIACDNLALRGSVRAACPQAPKGVRSTYGTFINPRKHPLSGLFLRNRGQPTISRQDELSKLMSVGTELTKEIQEIKRNWVPRSDNKNKENKENDQNKDKDKKSRNRGKKKGVNEVDAEKNTPTSTTDAP